MRPRKSTRAPASNFGRRRRISALSRRGQWTRRCRRSRRRNLKAAKVGGRRRTTPPPSESGSPPGPPGWGGSGPASGWFGGRLRAHRASDSLGPAPTGGQAQWLRPPPLAADHDVGWLPVAFASLSSILSCAWPGPPGGRCISLRCPSPPTQHAGSCGRARPSSLSAGARRPRPSVTVRRRRRRSGSGRCRKPGLPRLWPARSGSWTARRRLGPWLRRTQTQPTRDGGRRARPGPACQGPWGVVRRRRLRQQTTPDGGIPAQVLDVLFGPSRGCQTQS